MVQAQASLRERVMNGGALEVATMRARQTRDRIRTAAAELFDRDGFHETHLRAIAAAAGVTANTVLIHWRDKATLWRAATGRDAPDNAQLRARPRGPRRLPPEDILGVARAMFEEQTFEQVTVRAIAQRAGTSIGAIYYHWPDKVALWRAVFGTEPPVDSAHTRAALAVYERLGLLAPDIERELAELSSRQPREETIERLRAQFWSLMEFYQEASCELVSPGQT